MNLRQLTYFEQVAELQSFTRAAGVLHVAQPSLSRQIQLLEHDLGVLLFVRSDKGVKLTEAGVALQERTKSVLQQVRRIRDEVGQQSKTPRGELNIGLPPSLFHLLTVPLVCEYRKRYPDVQLFIAEGVSATMHEAVLTGKLDAAVISDAEPLGMLRSRLLLREQLYLVGPKAAGLAVERPLEVAALARRPLILTRRPNALRLLVEHALAKAGHRIEPVIDTDSTRLLCELVAHALGYSVLPFSAFAEAYRAGRLSVAPMRGLSVTWTQITSNERGVSLAGRKFGDLFTEVANRQLASGEWLCAAVLG
ncbi:MAG: LysR family transcriptional regulator [Burkholderiaceae bacterium]|nr:LysR family transcriptional regulator [Burkholderiaceae bacterium]